ncbi:unnamed protein product, partial [Ascophyllum nodosum]
IAHPSCGLPQASPPVPWEDVARRGNEKLRPRCGRRGERRSGSGRGRGSEAPSSREGRSAAAGSRAARRLHGL